MAQTTPPSVTTLPTAPQTTDGATLFATRADAFVAALATFRTQLVALALNMYDNCVDAFNSATASASSASASSASAAAASSSAAASAASAGATPWNAATNYAIGVRAISPLNGKVYRRLVAGVSATDPSLDAVNWLIAEPAGTPDYILQAAGLT